MNRSLCLLYCCLRHLNKFNSDFPVAGMRAQLLRLPIQADIRQIIASVRGAAADGIVLHISPYGSFDGTITGMQGNVAAAQMVNFNGAIGCSCIGRKAVQIPHMDSTVGCLEAYMAQT